MAVGAIAPLLRVVPGPQLNAQLQDQDRRRAQAEDTAATPDDMSELARYIRDQYEMMSNHRSSGNGWSDRLTAALRMFNGEYDASKRAAIAKFGGSDVYARVVAVKCRGASALLRDVYLSADRPWGIQPPADPDIPPDVIEEIQRLVQTEVQTMVALGAPLPDAGTIRDRVAQLMDAAKEAAKKNAEKQAASAEDMIEEILNEGGFYKAFAEFLVDVSIFPFACIKGLVVKIIPTVSWVGGQPQVIQKPRLTWERVSPFDLYWTPGVSDIEHASVVQRTRLTRADLNDALDLPGYNQAAIRAVLDEYGRGGIADDWDTTDSERAVYEKRENPRTNRSGMINCLEFHGNVQGRMLLEYGLPGTQVPDELRDYMVQAWLIGRYVIKAQITPSPRKRHPYYLTSFEKVPGTPVGNALPDILADIQDVCNATLRSLVNNMSIASGPQVIVNLDALDPSEDPNEFFPWKRWHVKSDPMGNNTQLPINFYQPSSISQELLMVYQKFTDMADDLSAIPRYLSGAGATAGAGRTASGLSMLITNAAKILQTVAANVDRDVMSEALSELYDMLMLTDTSGRLKGDESIRVLGVNVAVQRETQRSRQIEFLAITANPIDTQIMGTQGRAAVLRSVSNTIGLDGQEIVPSEEKLDALEKQRQQMMAESHAADVAKGGVSSGAPANAARITQGAQPPRPTNDMGPRERGPRVGGAPQPRVAGGVG